METKLPSRIPRIDTGVLLTKAGEVHRRDPERGGFTVCGKAIPEDSPKVSDNQILVHRLSKHSECWRSGGVA